MQKILKKNPEKDLIQNNALELFDKYNILLSWATGCGKSLAAIKCIEKDIKENNSEWYIACWETTHIDNWIKEFKEYNKESLLEHVEIFCYASIHKYTENRNIVLDEVHHITELSSKYIKTINPKRMVALSATVPDEKKMLLYQTVPFKEYNIPLSKAIDNNIIPPPKVYLVDITLDNTEKKYTIVMEKGNKLKRVPVTIEDYSKRFSEVAKYTDVTLTIKCTAQEKYAYMTDQVEYLKQQYFKTKAEWAKFKWLKAGNDRKKFIAEYKTPHAKELLKLVENKRYICFTGSTEQCKKLGGTSAISSTLNVNDYRIAKFNRGTLNKLYAVKMLREGINLYNIEAGLIIQLDNQEKSFTQMLGRVFRSRYPVMFIMVIKNTQDDKYLTTCLDGFDTKYLMKYEGQSAEEIFSN